MSSVSGSILSILGKVSAQASVVVVLILFLQWAFQKQLTPRARASLWLLLILRLLLPVSFTSATSIFNFFPRFAADSANLRVPAVPEPVTIPASERFGGEEIRDSSLLNAQKDIRRTTTRNSLSEPHPISASTVSAATDGSSPIKKSAIQFTLPEVLIVLWFCGVVILALLVLVSSLRWARKVRSLPMVSNDTIVALFAECRIELGVSRHLDLFETPHLSTPALHGFLRLRLLFPIGFLNRFPADQLRFIFLHELAHVRRRDIPLNWLITLLQILHWFNPLIWIGFSRWRVDRELACDALALDVAGPAKKKEYGQTILRLLENASHPFGAPGFVGILEDKRQLRERIRMIAAFVPARRWPLLAVLLMGAVCLVGLTDARTQSNRAESTVTNSPSVLVTHKLAEVPRSVATNGASVKITVMDAETGKPLPGSEIRAPDQSAFFGGGFSPPGWLSDVSGAATIHLGEVPTDILKQMTWFVMDVRHPGFAPQGLSWSAKKGDVRLTMPGEIKIELHRGITVGGNVRDEKGQPVENVKIRVYGTGYQYDPSQPHLKFAEYFMGAGKANVVTDSRGHWEVGDFPKDLANINIELLPPGTPPQKYAHAAHEGATFVAQGMPIDLSGLRAGNALFILKAGFTMHGKVLDPEGKPVANVRITEAAGLMNKRLIRELRSDEQGLFLLSNETPRQVLLTAYPDAFAISSTIVDFRSNSPTAELRLKPLSPLHIRVADEQDQAIPGVIITLDPYRTEQFLLNFSGVTSGDGALIWTNAPTGPIALMAAAPSGKRRRKIRLDGQAREVNIVLRDGMEREVVVNGSVHDADSGAPINIETVGFQSADHEGLTNAVAIGKPEFRLVIPSAGFRQGMQPSYQVQIRAKGYKTLLTDSRDFDEGDWNAKFKMQKTGTDLRTVLLSDGRPASGAEISRPQPEYLPLIINQSGRVSRDERVVQYTTDQEGHFTLDDPGYDFIVLITHQNGFLETSVASLRLQKTLKLEPWGKVEGILREGRKIVPAATVGLFGIQRRGMESWVFTILVQTDTQGRFAFDKVPAGQFLLQRWMGIESGPGASSHQVPVLVKNGHTTEVAYGGTGRPIIGQIDGNVDWSKETQLLVLKVTNAKPPAFDDFVTVKGFEAARDGFDAERKRQELSQRSYGLHFERDGSFRIEDVPSGTYELHILVREPLKEGEDSWRPRKIIASLIREVIVPETSGGRSDAPLDLGQLTLNWTDSRKAAPPFSFSAESLDGKTISSESFRGRPLLVAFWASWSERSTEALSDLREFYTHLARKDSLGFLNVNLSDDALTVMAVSQERGYQWQQTLLSGTDRIDLATKLGIETLPSIILLDRMGHIIGRDLQGDRLKSALTQAVAEQ
ncbi:MAG: hypothetical protein JWM99_864 [Verrucomicrobiales bacterium]|nr:hypothetical protein [Verrucomicrobiales bacterium]